MRGQQLEERRSKRYDALLDAGIELLGAQEGPAVNVRAVCRAAGLTERYFYESFTDRDTFVRAVYAWVGARAQETLENAVAGASPKDAVAAPVRAFVEIVVETPVNLTKKQKDLLQEFQGDAPASKNSPQSSGFFDKVKDLWEDLKD